MTSKKIEKSFDCIEYKRRVQQEIYEKIKDMTPEQEIEFFRKAVETGPFASLVRALEARKERPPSGTAAARSVSDQRQ